MCFCFDYEGSVDLGANALNRYANNFFLKNQLFKAYRNESGESFSQIFSKKDIMGGVYIRMIPTSTDIMDSDVTLVRNALGVSKSQQLENFVSNKNEDHTQYLNRKTNTAVEMAIVNSRKNFRGINQFVFSLAYLDYYTSQLEIISSMAYESSVSNYETLLDYARRISVFESVFFLKNPTLGTYYSNMSRHIGIEDVHEEFSIKLNLTTKLISVLHEQHEAKKNQAEELLKIASDKRYTQIGIAIGLASLISTLIDIIGFVFK